MSSVKHLQRQQPRLSGSNHLMMARLQTVSPPSRRAHLSFSSHLDLEFEKFAAAVCLFFAVVVVYAVVAATAAVL